MSRDWRLFIEDIVACCRAVRRYTAGLDFEAFVKDHRTFDAVLRNIELIGEAVKSIPHDVRAQYPQIPWQAIIGTRNMLAHVYFDVDEQIIWQVIQEEIEPLIVVLEEIRRGRTTG